MAAPYTVSQLTFLLSSHITLTLSPSSAISPFDSLRTKARDHRQNFCFLSVLRGRPECVARESYFRWVTRTCTRERAGKGGKGRRKKDVNAPPAAFPCLSLVLISLLRLYSISCSRETRRSAADVIIKRKETTGDTPDKMTEGWAWVCNLTRHCHPNRYYARHERHFSERLSFERDRLFNTFPRNSMELSTIRCAISI